MADKKIPGSLELLDPVMNEDSVSEKNTTDVYNTSNTIEISDSQS